MKFEVDKEKTIEALLWVIEKYGETQRFHALKTLYFADMEHLRRFGRPVTGDRYVAMENGPVPSYAYNALKGELPENERASLVAAINVINDRPQPYYQPHRLPDMNFFSRSDIECLEWAFEHCRKRSFGSISDETHEHVAWKRAGLNGTMHIDHMLDGADAEALEAAKEFAAYGVL